MADIVVADNHGSQKRTAVRRATRRAGNPDPQPTPFMSLKRENLAGVHDVCGRSGENRPGGDAGGPGRQAPFN